MIEIDELIILLNNYCNLRCTYCHFREDDPARFQTARPQDVDQAMTLFFTHLRARPQAPAILCFNADGEALLARDLLLDSLAHAAALRQEWGLAHTLIAVVTNGTLVDAALAEAFARLNVVVTVSVDGDAVAHNRHRRDAHGGPTYARVAAGIRRLQAAGVLVSLRAVISPETAPRLPAIYHALQALRPARPVKLRPMRMPAPPVLPPAWVETFTRAYVACVTDLIAQGTPLAALPDDAYAFARFLTGGGGRPAYCGAGARMLWLTPSGRFTSCGLFSHGDETFDALADVATADDLSDLLQHPRAQRLRAVAPANRAPCVTCRWLPVCRGGCPALTALPGESALSPLCAFYTALGEALEAILPPTPGPLDPLRSFDV